MSDDHDLTVSLLDQRENVKTLAYEDSDVRTAGKPVKMTATLLTYFLTFAVSVTLVYGVVISDNEKVLVPIEGKSQFFVQQNRSLSDPKWTYDCSNNTCNRRLLKDDEEQILLEKCNLLCFRPSLWPKPRSVIINEPSISTFRKNLLLTRIHSPEIVRHDIKQAVDIFMNNLPSAEETRLGEVDLTNVFVNIIVAKDIRKIKTNTDESYMLDIKKNSSSVVANINATTYFGARHGLETLSQLISLNTATNTLQIHHDIQIQDSPSFVHRGLMVDTARNFFPIEQLLGVLDGMAMNKLNVFHLHLTDSVSFPIVLPSNPWMAEYGSYGPDMVYKPDDIKDLVEYARIRGIRVILEIDAPSHANEGWNHLNTKKEKTIICGEDDVLNGHLNPDNDEAKKLLETVYSDLLTLGTDDETFHIGGDEVNLTCLAGTKAAGDGKDMTSFWAEYVNNILKIATRAFNNIPPKNLVIWSSDLTDWSLSSLKYSKNLVVQYWYGRLEPILFNGNKIIFSTVGKWYLDCGFGSWKAEGTNGACDPYTPWQTFYKYRPWQDHPSHIGQVLGGEACLWTEQVGVDTLETRIWPRTAAFAERLWSDIPKLDIYDVSTRLSEQRERLKRRGIKVATIWPHWCSLHPGKCI